MPALYPSKANRLSERCDRKLIGAARLKKAFLDVLENDYSFLLLVLGKTKWPSIRPRYPYGVKYGSSMAFTRHLMLALPVSL